MTKIALFIENGNEDIEFIAPLDILRRGGVEVDLISANNNKTVTTSHNVTVTVDKLLNEINIDNYDGIIIPGGMPGSDYLRDNDTVIKYLQKFYKEGKLVAALCAAPIVLNKAGITKESNITCYPSIEEKIKYKTYNKDKAVVIDRNVITAQGPTLAILFGYAILEYLEGKEVSQKISNDMLLPILKNNLK